MFNKTFLINKIVNSLLSNKYQVLVSQGAFDIAAKREELMLVKSMLNADSLNEEQALSLRSISYFLSAHPVIVSVKTNRIFLDDEIVYSRFKLPLVTPTLFENLLGQDEVITMNSSKGKHTLDIDADALRERRKQFGFTLEELAKLIGISKKALYEIEKKRVNPSEDTVRKLETKLKVELAKPFELPSVNQPTYLKPKNEFQHKVSDEIKRIGIDNSSVYSAPFEIVGKEKFSIITTLSKNSTKIKKEAGMVKKISRMFLTKAMFVAKSSKEKNIQGVPVLLESQLPKIESTKELNEIIEDRE
jgi:putative transcriptional regulator